MRHVWHPGSSARSAAHVAPNDLERRGAYRWSPQLGVVEADAPASEAGCRGAPPIERPTCPVCGSTTVRFRKTRNEWDHEAGLRGTLKQRHEGATFPQPKIALCPDKDLKRSVKEVVSAKYQKNS